ncbi:uncharacterized protein APUU_61053S [Aspergillus puulaauensis]|uniref:Mg2+ transporter protein, CorA-like/Zinc transport protein ZntB n=1 Tax=Aspergillus puulaauensis TaxID=1220207 RepID=A0A7R7XUJ2_9EURO|nr:uncharacterized protein APUU_61053S [Aspergillus puulaauensis]BCS28005.1 hypothetical protein APUU_61053S [Aspergillus puulaauensis]
MDRAVERTPPWVQIYQDVGDIDAWTNCGSETSIVEKEKSANFIIFVRSDIDDQDKSFKLRFQEEFRPVLDADINGSFDCHYGCSQSRVWPEVSWSCFKVKEVKTAADYSWKQPTIHVQWNAETGRQIIHIFGFKPDQQDVFMNKLPTAAERRCNPFSLHAAFARIILEQYNDAFWLLRDLVRNHEKARSKEKKEKRKKTKAEKEHERKMFPLLHDIARHLFHYQETIEVAEHTLQVMAKELIHWRHEDEGNIRANIGTWLDARRRIMHEEKRAHSLKTRSKSLNDRHQNEINLAFNLVSQDFGRDARSDSNMMTTVAFVSMVYLPGTFVSGLFGTNFFSFQADPGNTWLTADEFWMYWAVTIPLTLLTLGIWGVWHWWDTYVGWAQKMRQKRAESTKSDDHDATADIKMENFSLRQRILTATRLNEIQRKETV